MRSEFLPAGTDFLTCEETIGRLCADLFTMPDVREEKSSRLKVGIWIKVSVVRGEHDSH